MSISPKANSAHSDANYLKLISKLSTETVSNIELTKEMLNLVVVKHTTNNDLRSSHSDKRAT